MTKLQIEYFLAIVEHGGFTKASEALFVSQPTLSQQIASLETELGFKLFTRKRHAELLTEAGKLIYDFFSEMSETYRSVLAEACRVSGMQKRTLSVGILLMSDMRNVLSDIMNFCGKDNYTATFFSGKPHELAAMLLNGTLDIAFMFDDLMAAYPKLAYQPIYRSELNLILPANDPLTTKEDFSVEDLKGKTFFQAEGNTPPAVHMKRDQYLREIGIDGFPTTNVSSLDTAYSMVASGMGFSIGSDHNSALNSGLFHIIQTGVYHEMCVVYHLEQIPEFAKRCIESVFNITL